MPREDGPPSIWYPIALIVLIVAMALGAAWCAMWTIDTVTEVLRYP